MNTLVALVASTIACIGIALLSGHVIELHKKIAFVLNALAEIQTRLDPNLIALLAQKIDEIIDDNRKTSTGTQLELSQIQLKLVVIRALLVRENITTEQEFNNLLPLLADPSVKLVPREK
jgi:hypothetical protein